MYKIFKRVLKSIQDCLFNKYILLYNMFKKIYIACLQLIYNPICTIYLNFRIHTHNEFTPCLSSIKRFTHSNPNNTFLIQKIGIYFYVQSRGNTVNNYSWG